jgi:protein-S-isoprenylcysteine O-methyltransferase Ste14
LLKNNRKEIQMQTDALFRIILPTLIISFIVHRGYYARNHSLPGDITLKERRAGSVPKFAILLGVAAFISLAAYVINPNWLALAALPLPDWLRWTGLGVAVLGFILLQWAQNTLGRNWSDRPRMMKEQMLITSGPYHWMRHPIYFAFLLILGSTLLISANWLIGLSWLGMTAMEVASRINFEESLMIEYFGDQYREYMKTTGRLLPRASI